MSTPQNAIYYNDAPVYYDGSVVVFGGYMDVTESEQDSFSASGVVAISGSADLTESDQDVFAVSGGVAVTGMIGAVELFFDGSPVLYDDSQVVFGSYIFDQPEQDTFSASGRVTDYKESSTRRGVTVRHQRTKRKPIEIVFDLRAHKDIDEHEEEQTVEVAPAQPAPPIPSLTIAPPPVNVSAVIDAASDAYAYAVREYVRGAIAQMVFADAQAREAAELAARVEAEALFQAAVKFARDEDEAASLIMIMAVA